MKTIKNQKSLLETAYDIMKKHNKLILVSDLLKQTFQKHKIDSLNDFNAYNQLYLEITLSGQFIFCEHDCLIIKENNKKYWDKDFFEKPQISEVDEIQDLDFEDFLLEEDKIKSIANIELENEDNLEKIGKKSKIDITSEDKEDDYDNILEEEYENFYDK